MRRYVLLILLLLVLCMLIVRRGHAQNQVAIEGIHSYGNLKAFGGPTASTFESLAVEYDDHHSFKFAGGRMSYVGEILPIMRIREPKEANRWGYPETKEMDSTFGVGVAPVGFRVQWRVKRVRPYFYGKLGMVAFREKLYSRDAAYQNFIAQSKIGAEISLTQKVNLRVDGFNYTHISNAYMTRVNPGADYMGTSLGLSYNLSHPKVVTP